MQSLGAHDHNQEVSQPLQWQSSLETRPDDTTCIRAFVRLVSRVLVLDAGETYCIQDSIHDGVILARYFGCDNRDQEEDGAFDFIDCAKDQSIPTDFSIGEGQVS